MTEQPTPEQVLTPKAAQFIAANAQSPVIYGAVREPNPNKPPKGARYKLKDGRVFVLSVADCRSMPAPRWDIRAHEGEK